ncbi:MAG: outer membrane protein [Marinicella pacifica]
MKLRQLIGGIFALSAATGVLANDSDHALELGVSYLDASGFNAYGIDRPENEFEDVNNDDVVPYIGYRFTKNNWRVRAGFQDYGSVTRKGVSPDSDIFGIGDASAPVVTLFHVKEDVRNFNLDLTRLFSINDQWTFEVGPSINFVKQRASVVNLLSDEVLLKDTDNNVELGAFMGVNYALNSQVDLGFNYRFNQAADIDLHTFGVNLGWTF